MFIKQKSTVLFRNYSTFGYITDNRNFGYKKASSGNNFIGDKILSKSGAIFFSALTKKPQHISNLIKKIQSHFAAVDCKIIENDATDFYHMLEQNGFVVSGQSLQECEDNDLPFSYSSLEPEAIRHDSSAQIFPDNSTQIFLEEHFKGEPQLTNVHIEITSKCNERCIHCYIPHENKNCNINSKLFYDIIEQCKNMKVLHLTLSGGEPLLHKDFCNFLRKCREYDFSVNVLSNLTLLNDDIVKEMKANPLLGVQVSLYSMNPLIHDKITQLNGSLEKTKKGILKLVENNIPLQISCPIMKTNKSCYDDVTSWAKQHNIYAGDDYVIIARYNHTTQNLNCRLSIEEVKEVILNKAASDADFFKKMEQDAEKKSKFTQDDYVCSVCASSVCIAENGNAYPCAGWQDCVVGNLNKTSLKDIWEKSQKIKELRGLRNYNFPKCIHCTDKDFCTMCMVRNANENIDGNPLVVSEYFCNIAKLNHELTSQWKEKNS